MIVFTLKNMLCKLKLHYKNMLCKYIFGATYSAHNTRLCFRDISDIHTSLVVEIYVLSNQQSKHKCIHSYRRSNES